MVGLLYSSEAHMQFDFERMSPERRFEFMTGTIVPRPIGIVTTCGAGGSVNAAPYSFFGVDGPKAGLSTFMSKPEMRCLVWPTGPPRCGTTCMIKESVIIEKAAVPSAISMGPHSLSRSWWERLAMHWPI